MTYEQKCQRFRELIYTANGLKFPPEPRLATARGPDRSRWKNLDDLRDYLEYWGGSIVHECGIRKGHLVVDLEEGLEHFGRPRAIVEVPIEFAERVIIMGGFP